MQVKELTLKSPNYPHRLRNITTPPEQLFVLGQDVNELLLRPCIAIVGSRKVSAYGKTATYMLAEELARAGVVIISGLAIGVDSVAHQAALDAGGLTIAVLACGLDQVYPARNRQMAKQILQQGGALISEYRIGTDIYRSSFIARNRIVSGLSNAVIITEAAEHSGTLSTARFALEQGKDLLAIPGNINSYNSVGTNNLIKAGAAPVTTPQDVLNVLGIKAKKQVKKAIKGYDADEQSLLDLLQTGVQDGTELLAQSKLDVSRFNQTLTMLEIRGHIRPLGNNYWELQ